MAERDCDAVRRNNLGRFLAREQQVTKRWIEAATAKATTALLLQLYGPVSLHETLKGILGDARACFVRAEFPGEGQLQEYYRRLTACIRDHIARFALTVNPDRVTSELWGESFEGCVVGYGSAFAQHLELKHPPMMRLEMTVPDARFLLGARQLDTIPLQGSDIVACFFELEDGAPAAVYQSRQHAQWLDKRLIQLQLDPTRIQVCTKLGHTVWPPRPMQKGDSDAPQPYRLATSEDRWLIAYRMNLSDFRKVVASAIANAPVS